ncbi:MAG: DNA cytosine methyltransferase [Ruminococcaceae bacterium]|nr:DNA cytosine methyltransferase [Oscillospiraceae bacterium]
MLNVDKVLNGIKVIDLFSGIGGFHLALSSFGAEIVFASEWDKDAADVYSKNFGLVPQGDITKIDEKTIPEHDILCAGFPCQAFSISGNQKGFNDSRGTLFFDVARIAKEKQPKILFLENVKNLEVHNNGNTLTVITNTLNSIGYDVYYKVLDSAEYGSPQSRKRIYIVCFRKDMGISNFEFPSPTQKHKYVKDIVCAEDAEEYIINRNDIVIHKDDAELICETKPIRIGIVNKGGQGERIYSPKGKGITLSAYGGGVGAKTGLYRIDGKIRRLSPRECARMQGFPDSFIIADKDTVAYKQFGNSVVVDLLQQIVLQITNNKDVMKWL